VYSLVGSWEAPSAANTGVVDQSIEDAWVFLNLSYGGSKRGVVCDVELDKTDGAL
jgi:hypothetical protein